MAEQKLTFPDGFMWGTATASFQIEGASTEHRIDSIWDRFCATPGKVVNSHTGAEACDHFHRFRDDIVNLIKPLNTRYYRFSIAWPRIQTWDQDSGEASENEHGIAFYNALIDALLQHGITPVVTLYHWDLPLPVADRYNGWAGQPQIADAFAQYADICFSRFGDRVQWWITLNEPWCSSVLGYETGEHAPGDTTRPAVGLYLAAHNLLRAHAAAVEVYRRKHQEAQGGKIGITMNTKWIAPVDAGDAASVAAAERGLAFELGWFADPVYFGDYPEIMRDVVGDRLPTFSDAEKRSLKGSSDFFGLNHYSTMYARRVRGEDALRLEAPSYWRDCGVDETADPKWRNTDMNWPIVPWGLTDLLRHIQARYAPRGGIIVTENGLAVAEASAEDARAKGAERIRFFQGYIAAVHAAMHAGEVKADVRGYFLWSLMDNFEWALGYTKRFGLYFVDYETQKRVAKPAVEWYASVVRDNAVPATFALE